MEDLLHLFDKGAFPRFTSTCTGREKPLEVEAYHQHTTLCPLVSTQVSSQIDIPCKGIVEQIQAEVLVHLTYTHGVFTLPLVFLPPTFHCKDLHSLSLSLCLTCTHRHKQKDTRSTHNIPYTTSVSPKICDCFQSTVCHYKTPNDKRLSNDQLECTAPEIQFTCPTLTLPYLCPNPNLDFHCCVSQQERIRTGD